MSQEQLSLVKKFSYGVGHVLNDLSASMWFSYLLIYLHRIVNFENALAGYMMLLGQIADALATAFVGFESDRTENGFWNYGRRKSWHLVGVISVLISFPFMFNLCFGCENSPSWARFYYYAPFVVIFQFGWAASQISHLALIPQLTSDEHERVSLNAIRYAFTVGSNLFVYGVTYLLLKINDSSDEDNNLSRNDAPKFMYLSLIVCGVGLFFQVIFHLGTNEKNLPSDDEMHRKGLSMSTRVRLSWSDYLKCYRFYAMGILYMATRLIVNMTQVYLPMFLTDTLELEKSSIALIPLICYISGFLSTFPLKTLNKFFGSYITCFVGLCFIMGSSLLFWYYDLIQDKNMTSIVNSILLGCGSTIILVSSLALTTDLIGCNTGSGAFVFGAMSFTDKLSNGIAVALLQQFSPCEFHATSCDCRGYYRLIMALLPAFSAIVALVSLVVLFFLNRSFQSQANLLVVNQNTNERDEDENFNDSARSYGTISSS